MDSHPALVAYRQVASIETDALEVGVCLHTQHHTRVCPMRIFKIFKAKEKKERTTPDHPIPLLALTEPL